jgi:hypothetical protein
MTALPNSEMLLFGGEFCDGAGTTVYNELFRWNLEKQEWRQIESLNTPPPRCSHQAVFYKEKVYIFGGEYATLDQFHHYSDMWALDLKTNVWTEIVRPKGKADWPSPRSGHRMVLWRGYIVLFGGFYEALREVRWYNDLFLFSFQDERWTGVPYRPHSQVPKARSGFLMTVYAQDDTIFVHGGYSREKVMVTQKTSGGQQQKKSMEGVVHQDTWVINLKPAISAAATATAAKGKLDTSKLSWQRIARKGTPPPPRCGAVMVPFKNKGIVFGGVMDTEGLGHSMVSTFYNDIYAFDFERRRWYQLGLKSKKAPVGAGKKRGKKAKTGDSSEDGGSDGGSEAGSESDNEEDREESKMDSGDYFGYIDETGNVVYLDLNAPDPDDEAAGGAEGKEGTEIAAAKADGSGGVAETVFEFSDMKLAAPAPKGEEGKGEESKGEESKGEESKGEETFLAEAPAEIEKEKEKAPSASAAEPPPPQLSAGGAGGLARYFGSLSSPAPRINPCIMLRGNTLYVYGGVTELGDIEVTLDDCWTLDLNKRDNWKSVLPGTMQTLNWKGEADDSTSARSGDDTSDSDDYGFSDDDEDEDEDEDEEGMALAEGENEDQSSGEDADAAGAGAEAVAGGGAVEGEEKPPREKKKDRSKDPKDKDKARGGRGGGDAEGGGLTAGMRVKEGRRDRNAPRSAAGGTGLMAEINTVRAELPCEGAEEENPFPAESLREFFSRTAALWKQRAAEDWQRKNAAGAEGEGEAEAAPEAVSAEDAALILQHQRQKLEYGRVVEEPTEAEGPVKLKTSLTISEALSDKDIKRIAFELADARFQLVLPVMDRLRDLEGQLEEGGGGERGAGGGGKKSSSSRGGGGGGGKQDAGTPKKKSSSTSGSISSKKSK